MLAVPYVDFVPEHALDRVGRSARGLRARIERFNSVYEPEIARTPATREQLDGHVAEQVGERRRRLERHGDTLCDQGLKVRASVRWDYPFGEAVVRQVLRSCLSCRRSRRASDAVPASDCSTNTVRPRSSVDLGRLRQGHPSNSSH